MTRGLHGWGGGIGSLRAAGSTPAPATILPARTPDPAKCPVTVYLAGLMPSARRAQGSALRMVAGLLAPGVPPLLVPWERIEAAHLEALRTVLAGRYAPGTANRYLGAVRGVLRVAWRLGLLATEERLRLEDVRGVPGSRLPPGRRLLPEEVRRLVEVSGLRLRAAVALCYGCGLRAAEACWLPWGDWTGAEVRVVGKGGKEREVPVPDRLALLVMEWGDHSGGRVDHAPVLAHDGRALHPNSLGSTLRRAAKRAGLGHVTPHDLRRSFASNLLAGGMDLALVQRLMGHADPRTTAGYDRRDLDLSRPGVDALYP